MNRERGLATRSGINKQGWQSSDFPLACDRCYGQNPFMRMLKQNFGQECRICFRPFTVFKWKGNKGIFKRTCVCQFCSKQKNICQVCTLDLQFGLPMDIRDKRCGKNGKNLINDNFTSEDNLKARPPPPPTPPPSLSKVTEKELVYVLKEIQQGDEDDQGAGRVVVQKKLLIEGAQPSQQKEQKNQGEQQKHQKSQGEQEKHQKNPEEKDQIQKEPVEQVEQ